METHNYDILIRVLLLGLDKVGKTTFRQTFCETIKDKEYLPTIGVDFSIKIIHSHDMRVKL